MAYEVPQASVFIDYNEQAVVEDQPLHACVVGGNARLIRFDQESERADGLLGYYGAGADADYAWPNREAGGIVDDSSVRLWMTDALLKYAVYPQGATYDVVKVEDYTNRVRSSVVEFATNDASDRHSTLESRDVQINDVAKVESTDAPVLWTYVRDIVADVQAAVTGAASADAGNASTASASAAVTQVAGVENNVAIASSAAAFSGLAKGNVVETYTVRVIQGSTDRDYTTARLRVTSASGLDDVVADVTPSAHGVAFALGTQGATMTITDTDLAPNSASAVNAGVGSDDLVEGQVFEIVVTQAFTAPVATSSGTYDGTKDTVYLIEVVQGGLWADSPKIRVSTNNGVDYSVPVPVTAPASAVEVGSKGVMVAFSQAGLRKGDRWSIAATAATAGPLRTLVFGHDLSDAIAENSRVGITLYIRKAELEIPRGRTGQAPLVNFETSETEITVKAGIEVYDSSWVDGAGDPLPLEVHSASARGFGRVYAEYRQWLQDLVTSSLASLSSTGDLGQIPGALHPDNPLKWAFYRALLNSNGVRVLGLAVSNPSDSDDWVTALETLESSTETYSLVPLTKDRAIVDLFVGHANTMSAPKYTQFRRVWMSLVGYEQIPLVHAGTDVPGHTVATSTDGEVVLATILDDPDTTDTQYTIVNVPEGNADFIAAGVRAKDVVRALYADDGFGDLSYEEFTIDAVTTENRLRLVAGPDAAINVASRIEIWRNAKPADEAPEIASHVGYANELVSAVWPDRFESGEGSESGVFLCAALAGLASGVLPHQTLTRVEIIGPTGMSRSARFKPSQLDALATAGIHIVVQSVQTGVCYSRHALTTAGYESEKRGEEMIVRNVHSIGFRFLALADTYVAATNAQELARRQLEKDGYALATRLRTEKQTVSLGGQIIDIRSIKATIDPTNAKRMPLDVEITVPHPTNSVPVTIRL